MFEHGEEVQSILVTPSLNLASIVVLVLSAVLASIVVPASRNGSILRGDPGVKKWLQGQMDHQGIHA